jgi:hypothetical protein
LINKKIYNYKNDLDNTVKNIEKEKESLTVQEKKFNKFIDMVNTSNKIINHIKDIIQNNTRELEIISTNEDKIINDLDEIEKNLDKRTKDKKSKEDLLKENNTKNIKIENTFNEIEIKIANCHKMMRDNNNFVNCEDIKTMNQLLNNIHCKIKRDIQGKEIEYINKIFKAEKKIISEIE